jgi:hypothetical protein
MRLVWALCVLLGLLGLGAAKRECIWCQRFDRTDGCEVECASEAGWCCVSKKKFDEFYDN